MSWKHINVPCSLPGQKLLLSSVFLLFCWMFFYGKQWCLETYKWVLFSKNFLISIPFITIVSILSVQAVSQVTMTFVHESCFCKGRQNILASGKMQLNNEWRGYFYYHKCKIGWKELQQRASQNKSGLICAYQHVTVTSRVRPCSSQDFPHRAIDNFFICLRRWNLIYVVDLPTLNLLSRVS